MASKATNIQPQGQQQPGPQPQPQPLSELQPQSLLQSELKHVKITVTTTNIAENTNRTERDIYSYSSYVVHVKNCIQLISMEFRIIGDVICHQNSLRSDLAMVKG